MSEKYKEYYSQFVVEDREDIETICKTASSLINDRFRTNLGDDHELLGAIFIKTFETIVSNLSEFQSNYSSFKINICDRMEIGYSDLVDEDDEKQGNFMIFMRHLKSNKKNESTLDSGAKAKQLVTEWMSQNVVNTPKTITKISVDTLENLKNIEINVGISELIFPIFITTYETLINFLRVKRKELDKFEHEINFLGCFNIGARETDDDDDIYINPHVADKLKLKSDEKISSKHE